MTVGSGGTVLSGGELKAVFTTQTIDTANYTDIISTYDGLNVNKPSVESTLNITTIFSNNKKIYNNVQIIPKERIQTFFYTVNGNQQLLVESGLNKGDVYLCYLLTLYRDEKVICYTKEATVDSNGNLYLNINNGNGIYSTTASETYVRILNQIPHYLKSSA